MQIQLLFLLYFNWERAQNSSSCIPEPDMRVNGCVVFCPASAGTGYSQERHEPPPARVHGDVFDEERAGRPDGDLQETHHTERRQVRTHVELFDVNLMRRERQTDANSRINLSHVSNRKSTSLITLSVDDSDSEEKERKKPALPADSESSDSCCDANAAIPPLTWRKP